MQNGNKNKYTLDNVINKCVHVLIHTKSILGINWTVSRV